SCQPGSWTTAQSPVVSQPAANQPNAGPAPVKSLDTFLLTAMFLDLQKLTLLLLLPLHLWGFNSNFKGLSRLMSKYDF
ncbi:hypothetical protein EI555_004166, partial [Monodon monoceros]